MSGGLRLEPAALLVGRQPGRELVQLALEVGAGQAIAVEELALAAGFARTARRADLAGIDRVVSAWR